MRKTINILAVVIVIGLAIGYFTVGPNFFLGGPKNSDIVDVVRGVMVATAPGSAEAERAKTAKVVPKGFCNHSADGSYACIVDVTVEGSATTTFVAQLKKSADGGWISAE
jgi:hypothetical protein